MEVQEQKQAGLQLLYHIESINHLISLLAINNVKKMLIASSLNINQLVLQKLAI
jgi:hypothetical protein